MLEEALKLIKKVILEEAGKLGIGVEKIILFGSRARGEAREESDYDILVVVEEAEWRKRRKLSQAVRRRLRPILKSQIDILIYTVKEITWRIKVEGSFERDIIEEGIPVV